MTKFEKQTVIYRVIYKKKQTNKQTKKKKKKKKKKKNRSDAHLETMRKKLAKFLTDS